MALSWLRKKSAIQCTLLAFLLLFSTILRAETPAGFGFLFEFNGTAGGGTQFQAPVGIAVDGSGNSYVADNTLDTVQVFDSTGSFLFAFDGTAGGGTQFQTPRRVAVDGSGNIYVTDSALDIVQVFDSTGSFLFAFDGTVGGGTQFEFPLGIAVDGVGNIYVVDSSLRTVQVFGVPLSGLSLNGKCKKNTFLTESELFNVIQWSPIENAGTLSSSLIYRLFRDGDLLIVVVGNQPNSFEDHNLKRGRTYTYLLTVERDSSIIEERSISVRCK